MKRKSFMVIGLLLAGILSGCNGQSVTTANALEVESATTEIESMTSENETTTVEIESTTIVDTTAETFDAKKDGDVNSTGSDTTLGADEYQGEDFAPAPSTSKGIVIADDVPKKYRDKLLKQPKDILECIDCDENGIITAAEVEDFIFVLGEDILDSPSSGESSSGSSGSTGSTGGSVDWSNYGTPSTGEVPPEVDYSDVDWSKMSPTAEVY